MGENRTNRPRTRTKVSGLAERVPHRVPLSPAALAILRQLPRVAGTDVVFQGRSAQGKLSENTLNEVIKRMHARDPVPSDAQGRPAVVHGMRSTFRNWGRALTSFRPELLELSLAHTVGNAAERAYARGDALEQRREVWWRGRPSLPDSLGVAERVCPQGARAASRMSSERNLGAQAAVEDAALVGSLLELAIVSDPATPTRGAGLATPRPWPSA